MHERMLECIEKWNDLAGNYKRKGQRVVRYDFVKKRTLQKGSLWYGLVLNDARSDDYRPGTKEPMSCVSGKPCDFDQKLDLETIIDDDKYGPWRMCINVYPIDFGSSLVIHEQCPGRKQNDIQQEDLENMTQLSCDTGFRIFHNSVPYIQTVPNMGEGKFVIGTAASINHLHYQAVLGKFPIENFGKWISKYPDTFTMKDYPGANAVFCGKDATKKAYELINELNENLIAHTIFIADNEIYVFPRKKETPSLTLKKAGGYEIAGNLVITDVRADGKLIRNGRQLFEDITYEQVNDALKEVLYQPDELDALLKK